MKRMISVFDICKFLATSLRISVLSIIFFSMVACNSTATLSAAKADTIVVHDKELVPEGIAVHPGTGTVYLSSLHKNKIISIDQNGNHTDLITAGQNGFMKGLGMKISKDGKTLWACSADVDSIKSVSGLFAIDLGSGNVVYSYFHRQDSTSLFNDLVIHSSGDIFITDSYQGTVFRYQPANKVIELWLQSDQLTLANGIAFSDDEKVLFVASGDKGIQRIDLKTKQVTPVSKGQRTDYAIDGLVYFRQALFGVIGWPHDQVQDHRVLRYHLSDDYFLKSVDTIIINKPYLRAPTTAALYNNQLYVLGKTNLDLYNKNQQTVSGIEQTLQFPLIVRIPLK